MKLSVIMVIIRWFNESLKRRPITTEVLTAFVLTYSSDAICQYILKPKEKSYTECFENKRACNLAFFRAGFVTPIFHYWYKFLDKKYPSSSLSMIFAKSLLDRLTVGSFVLMSFFVSQHYLNGGNTPDLKDKIERDFPSALKMNVTVWISALMFNFKFVPILYQVQFVNTVGFFWMIYLSWTMNKNTQNNNKKV